VERDENSIEVWYEVYNPVKGSWEKRDSTSYRSDPGEQWLMRKLLNQDGIVAWNIDNFNDFSNIYLEKRVEYVAYNPVKDSWEKGSDSYYPVGSDKWLMRKLLNQDGIVVWNIDHYDGSDRYLEKRVEYAVYDLAKGRWEKGSDSYSPGFGDQWLMRKLLNQDGVVAWHIDHYDGSDIYLEKRVEYVAYNPVKDRSPLAGLIDLETLHLWWNPITDISPLAGLINLENLVFVGNQITDLSPLAGLINLNHLRLDDNQIIDISSLAGLTDLESLSLDENRITDLSPLAGLTILKLLSLDENGISDISPLAGLTILENLSLHENRITDLSSLTGLINLNYLRLDDNQIIDISPLVSNDGLDEGDTINLHYNPLNAAAYESHIPVLQKRGVYVLFDPPSKSTNSDVNGDGTVNISDLTPVIITFGESGGNLIGDVNHDGTVDIFDLVLIGRHLGE